MPKYYEFRETIGADTPGRYYCYLHVIGVPMVRGFAGGYGYDKHSAAVQNAAPKVKLDKTPTTSIRPGAQSLKDILTGPALDAGHWDNILRSRGYDVWQAV